MSYVRPLIETDVVSPNESVAQSREDLLQFAAPWSASRKFQFVSQTLRSAVPLFVVDQISQALVMFGVFAIYAFAFQQSFDGWLAKLIIIQGLISFVAFFSLRLYPAIGMHPVIELRQSVGALAVSFGSSFLAVLLGESISWKLMAYLAVSGCLCILIVPTIRQISRTMLGRSNWWRQPMIIFASKGKADAIWRYFVRQPELGWRPVCVIEDHHLELEGSDELSPSLHPLETDDKPPQVHLATAIDVPKLAQRNEVFWGVLDSASLPSAEVQTIVEQHHPTLPKLVVISSEPGSPALWVEGAECAGLPGLTFRRSLNLPVPQLVKRLVDIVLVSTILLVALPIMGTIALLIKLTSKGPIFYSQPRTGRFGKNFRIWKFRSMVVNAEKILQEYLANHPELSEEWRKNIKLEKDPRITWLGRFLRKTSLDELPQLFNVLTGEMSLVGPRPILLEEAEKYGSVYSLYAQVRPGITGLWQINGRNNTSYEQRLFYVSYYVRNWNVWLDWYILLRTFRVVAFCEGAS